ncbi:MAG: PEP-CTERM sorting domain-containing protein [Planctomycetaceae bacterium]
MLILACFGLGSVSEVRAGYIYADSVYSISGTIVDGNPDPTALGPPDVVLGNSGGIQFGAGAALTLDFGSLLSAPGTLSIFTFDNDFPAAASVEISADGSLFSLVAASVIDTNGVTAPPFYPHADFSITTPFRYVRLTDLGDAGGFDLDAVGYLESDVAEVPEPASLTLLGLGALGFSGIRRRRSPTPKL